MREEVEQYEDWVPDEPNYLNLINIAMFRWTTGDVIIGLVKILILLLLAFSIAKPFRAKRMEIVTRKAYDAGYLQATDALSPGMYHIGNGTAVIRYWDTVQVEQNEYNEIVIKR